MGFRDESNNLVGFDVDMANAVGEILGVTITFQPIDWDSKELELNSKRIDVIWNGLSVTPERMENMSMSMMYLNNSNVVMALNPEVVIDKEEDLANYKIGTQADSSALHVMQASDSFDLYAENVSEYRTFDEAILDMQAGRVDCIVVDQVLGEYKNSKMDEKMTVCNFNFGDDFFAIGARKADTTLTDKLNEALQQLIDEGKAAEISNKWFGKDIVILKGHEE
jgi:polar amino acid transport system substrate-binding protein